MSASSLLSLSSEAFTTNIAESSFRYTQVDGRAEIAAEFVRLKVM